MSDRRTISKGIRKQVYEKYGGHCAYCGCELKYEDMQVDHIEPLYVHEKAYTSGKADFLDDVENLMPACRMCNFYKSTYSTEKFRERIETTKDRLKKMFIYRLALKYGIVEEKSREVRFFFEKAEDGNDKEGI